MTRPDGPDDRLRHLAAFGKSLTALPWFAATGTPLDPAEQNDARAYLDGLDLPACEIQSAGSWDAAGDIVKRSDFSPQWWSAEDSLADALMDDAARTFGHDSLVARLSGIERAASDHLQGVASTALARDGLADAGLGKSAAGSATVAVHHAALALAAGAAGSHPFAAKFRLFQAGRWPLGVYADVFYVH